MPNHQSVVMDEKVSGVHNENASLASDEPVAATGPNGFYHDKDHTGELTPEELEIEKKLKFRIDSLIMPMVILVYLMNYIDRNNYAAARLQGLEADLHLTPQQYQTGLSILFVSYILMQVPSNLLLNYTGRPSLYLGFFTIAWGLVSALTSQVKNYSGIVICRFVLGLVEAPFFAGILFYLSKWYTKKELNLRMSIFYSGSLISGAFGSLIAAGILNGLKGKNGLTAWQWLYIIEGVITVGIGIVIVVILPDFPSTWRVLSPEMKHVAERRMAIDAAQADVDEPGVKAQIQGLVAALSDSRTYILSIAYLCIVGASGFQNFFPTLTATLGYNKTISLLLVAPPYIFITFWSYGHGIMSDRLGMRFWFFVYPIPISIIGFLVFMFANSFGAKYFSFFLMNFVFASNGTIYSWIANAIPRPPAKRAAALAFINSIGNSASIWTPYTYLPKEAPHYRTALGICIALQVLAFVCAVALRIVLTRANKKLDRLAQEGQDTLSGNEEILRKTAEMEGVSISEARKLAKGYRYTI